LDPLAVWFALDTDKNNEFKEDNSDNDFNERKAGLNTSTHSTSPSETEFVDIPGRRYKRFVNEIDKERVKGRSSKIINKVEDKLSGVGRVFFFFYDFF
jgi:hypothetical protein